MYLPCGTFWFQSHQGDHSYKKQEIEDIIGVDDVLFLVQTDTLE